MADEVGGSGLDDINSGGQVREDTNKVTEEAVRRVQDNQKKAQQVGQEIKNDKATNGKYAKFLTFLLKDIKNDHLIKQIYHVFFKEGLVFFHCGTTKMEFHCGELQGIGHLRFVFEWRFDKIGGHWRFHACLSFDGQHQHR